MDAAPATVVWLSPAPADGDQTRALASWARAHGVILVSPEGDARPELGVDPAVADAVETLLARAREALTARDRDAADAAIDSAEATLRQHPELPQAAWLMAETLRTRAECRRRLPPLDEAAAATAWSHAAALDGGRVSGAGEGAGPAPPAAAVTFSPIPARAAVLRVDGEVVASGTLSTRAGPHVATLAVGGGLVWATWFVAPAGTSAVRIDAAAATPCSRPDVDRVTFADDAPDAAGVVCPSWLAVTAGPDGAVRVAQCAGEHCGPAAMWRAPLPWTYDPPDRREHGAWPAWATWTLVGAGAVLAGTVGLVASGALSPAPTETRFVTGGVRTR